MAIIRAVTEAKWPTRARPRVFNDTPSQAARAVTMVIKPTIVKASRTVPFTRSIPVVPGWASAQAIKLDIKRTESAAGQRRVVFLIWGTHSMPALG